MGTLRLNSQLQNWLKWLALLCIATAVFGVAIGNRGFSKVQLGGLYILEAMFLGVACIALLTGGLRTLWGRRQLLLPFVLFFAWGLVLLLRDLGAVGWDYRLLPLQRVAQHSIIFMYPLMWTTIGVWLDAALPRGSRLITWLVFALAAYPSFRGEIVGNISLGPLLTIPAMMLFHQALHPSESEQRSWHRWLLAVSLLFFSFLPHWFAWLKKIQRTTLILSALAILAVPLVVAWKRNRSLKNALVTSLVAAALLVTGFGVTTLIRNTFPPEPTRHRVEYFEERSGFGNKIANDFFNSFQKGEDVPDMTIEGFVPFQGRFRKYCWKTAITDWLESPILGRGFVPEIPSSIQPDMPNTGGYERPGAPPVSGPHNSYLTILARMGIPGVLVFMFLAWTCLDSARTVLKSESLSLELLLVMGVLVNGAVHAAFNIGLESPHNSLVMWLAAGVLLSRASHSREASRSFSSDLR